MKRSERRSWRGLYALIPLTLVLTFVASLARARGILHQVLLLVVVVVVALLSLLWSEKHEDLIGSEGVDAQAEEDSLDAAGIERGRFAPSLTARQAHYRRVVLARKADESYNRTGESG